MEYTYKLNAAYAQCGTEPPYNCLNIPVRNDDGNPQIKISGKWIDFPKDGPRPTVKRYFGLPVAGISSDWELV